MNRQRLWPQKPRRLSRLILQLGIASILTSLISPLWLKLVIAMLVVWLTNETSTKYIEALLVQRLQKHIKAIVLQTLLELGLFPANHREQDLLK